MRGVFATLGWAHSHRIVWLYNEVAVVIPHAAAQCDNKVSSLFFHAAFITRNGSRSSAFNIFRCPNGAVFSFMADARAGDGSRLPNNPGKH